jgi:hypothetical protein
MIQTLFSNDTKFSNTPFSLEGVSRGQKWSLKFGLLSRKKDHVSGVSIIQRYHHRPIFQLSALLIYFAFKFFFSPKYFILKRTAKALPTYMVLDTGWKECYKYNNLPEDASPKKKQREGKYQSKSDLQLHLYRS